METRSLSVHRHERGLAKGRNHLAERWFAVYVAIHNGAEVVWKSGRLASLCRDSSMSLSSLFSFTQKLQSSRYLLERFGQSAIEVCIRWLRRSAQWIAGALPRGARRVADVVRGNPHESSRVKG